ncbi:hypothetical protein FJ492_09875 [Mesorhizobium sp. B2-5-4]|nr:hypothetical protein FJ492_09875 [Mesorhizobium sp. B2-5-4]
MFRRDFAKCSFVFRNCFLWLTGQTPHLGTARPSGNLLPRGPKARAATGGSVGGAGTSGVS